jgi:hypothetical protein
MSFATIGGPPQVAALPIRWRLDPGQTGARGER